MTNRLIDKAHSYTTVTGIDFDDAFTGSNWPTTYGTSSFSTGGKQILNTNNGLTSTANDGPFPGQRSWRFQNSNGGKAARLRWSSYGSQTTFGSTYLRPQTFTYAVWVRVNSMDANPFYNRAFSEYLCDTSSGGTGAGDDWFSGWYFGYVKNNESTDPNYGLPVFNVYSGGHDNYISTDDKGNWIQYNTWYLLGLRKTKINSTTVQMEFTINGVNQFTQTHTFEDYASTILDMGNSDSTKWVDHSLASAIYGNSTVFTTSVLRDIYLSGAPIQLPVKYYNGSAWVTSSNQQIWNGSKWIPMFANKWDGSAWQPI